MTGFLLTAKQKLMLCINKRLYRSQRRHWFNADQFPTVCVFHAKPADRIRLSHAVRSKRGNLRKCNFPHCWKRNLHHQSARPLPGKFPWCTVGSLNFQIPRKYCHIPAAKWRRRTRRLDPSQFPKQHGERAYILLYSPLHLQCPDYPSGGGPGCQSNSHSPVSYTHLTLPTTPYV